jgi:hypothetical protein
MGRNCGFVSLVTARNPRQSIEVSANVYRCTFGADRHSRRNRALYRQSRARIAVALYVLGYLFAHLFAYQELIVIFFSHYSCCYPLIAAERNYRISVLGLW